MRSSHHPGAVSLALVGLVTLAAIPRPVVAQFAPGSTVTFTGTANATDVGVRGVMLDFTKQVVASQSGNTGTFAALNTRGGDGASGKIASVLVGNGPQYIGNFLQFGGYKFTLQGLPSGSYGQDACYTEDVAAGQTCTPFQSVQGNPYVNDGLSPFSVVNVSANEDGSLNSIASFALYGFVTGPGGISSPFTGTIAASFTGLPYQYVLYTLEQEGLQDLSFTGTFTTDLAALADPTATPEPSTLGLVVAGLIGTGVVARRTRRTRVRG